MLHVLHGFCAHVRPSVACLLNFGLLALKFRA